MKTLVVDDDACISEMLETILRVVYGHDVTEASSSAEAIELIRSENFDLVITDNDMAKQNDGFSVIEFARALPNRPYVIWMSGRVDCNPELADQASSLGACKILAKPFSVKELGMMIRGIEADQKLEII